MLHKRSPYKNSELNFKIVKLKTSSDIMKMKTLNLRLGSNHSKLITSKSFKTLNKNLNSKKSKFNKNATSNGKSTKTRKVTF
jgi:hypothetical protein